MTNAPLPISPTTTESHPHDRWPVMRDPTTALAEALAVAEGRLHSFWGSASHREAYIATARRMREALAHRGYDLEPI